MKHQPPQVRARFAMCFVGDVVISAITLAELEFGVACSGEAQSANQGHLAACLKTSWLPRLKPGQRVAHRARDKKDALDKLIASHARSLGVTLVTNNEADFLGFAGLTVENWVNNHGSRCGGDILQAENDRQRCASPGYKGLAARYIS